MKHGGTSRTGGRERRTAAGGTPTRRLLPAALAFGGTVLLVGVLLPLGPVARGEDRPGEGFAVPSARTLARVELGRRLFFDPRVSRSGLRSCASCHDPDHGFSDVAVRSDDDFALTERHAQTLIDAADNPSAHWDGEFESVEDLVTGRLGIPSLGRYGDQRRRPGPEPIPPIQPPGVPSAPAGPPPTGTPEAFLLGLRPAAHGVPLTIPQLARLEPVHDVLEASGRYDEAFAAAFGSSRINTSRLAAAIGAYVRTIRSTESPLDRFLDGEETALSPAARRGLDLFRGEAGCAECHTMRGRHPSFTDYEFHNTGISWRALGREAPNRSFNEPTRFMDAGRWRASGVNSARRAFKTPTLRDVARRGPFMHDGSFESLEEVIRHYAAGGTAADPLLDRRLQELDLTDEDVADLVAFLESLTGEIRPGLAPTLWRHRAERTRIRFVDGRGAPIAGLPVLLQPVGDTLPGDMPLTTHSIRASTSDAGWIEFTPGHRTHSQIVLADDLPITGGALVPDTCRRVVIELPIHGTATLDVTFRSGHRAPDTLVVEHMTEIPLPPEARPRTVMRRRGLVEVAGRPVARYEAAFRTDASPRVHVRIPGDRGRDARKPRVELVRDEVVRIDLGDE